MVLIIYTIIYKVTLMDKIVIGLFYRTPIILYF